MTKLRLLLSEECNRKCKGCCNKDWNLDQLPVCIDYSQYSEILITGGEPLLNITKVLRCIKNIRQANPIAKIYVYTAWRERYIDIFNIINSADGITLTLHTKKDIQAFIEINNCVKRWHWSIKEENKSLRLNVFKGINLDNIDLSMWKVQDQMIWVKDCPLPKDEIFMRYEQP
jgi:hypothetical protein